MVRTDFVSNSSSSSFVLKTKKNIFNKSTLEKFLSFFSSGEQLDEYNVNEFDLCTRFNVVWSIFDFEFYVDLDKKKGKYGKYYNIPPMECLDIEQESIDDILENIFKDEEGGFESNGFVFYHEDFVFNHMGIAILNKKSVEFTRKILQMIKKDGWSFKYKDPKFCVIKNHLVKEKYKDDEDGKEYVRPIKYNTIEEAEAFLDKLEKDLDNDIKYIVIAMSYSGDSYCNGKLWYDKDWDNEKSCYKLIDENDFGETFYVDW